MNKALAVICVIGMTAATGIIAYILTNKDPVVPVVQKEPTHPVAPPKVVEAKLEKRMVAGGFDNPCGLAVQPGTGHLFISTKDRIVRVIPGDPYAVHDEITGFPTDSFGKGPVYEFGPLGLAFAGESILVVGDGSQDDGKEIVRIYTVGAQPLPKDKVRKCEDMTSYSTSIPAGDDSLQGEGNFYGVAVRYATVFVTSNGDDTKGWICKLELDLKKPAPLKLLPFIKSKELTDTDAPMGATISPEGKLVVSQFGRTTDAADSLLTFYDPATGSLEKMLKTGLRDLLGIAYSPKTGKLYGLDFAWASPSKGGLFRLDIGPNEVNAVKLADLEHPTALAFSPAGKLYVTALGSDQDQGKKTGQLFVFDGL